MDFEHSTVEEVDRVAGGGCSHKYRSFVGCSCACGSPRPIRASRVARAAATTLPLPDSLQRAEAVLKQKPRRGILALGSSFIQDPSCRHVEDEA